MLKQYAPDSGGPRQPWHDWHCKIEGHAAYDVLKNFEQRWNKATRKHDDELLDINKLERLLDPSNRAPLSGDPTLAVTNDHDADTWQVQVGLKNYILTCVNNSNFCCFLLVVGEQLLLDGQSHSVVLIYCHFE